MRAVSRRLSLRGCSRRLAIHPNGMTAVTRERSHSGRLGAGSRHCRLRCFRVCPGSSTRTRWRASSPSGCRGGTGRQRCRCPSGAVCRSRRTLSPWRGMPGTLGGSHRIFVSSAYMSRSRLVTVGSEACYDGAEWKGGEAVLPRGVPQLHTKAEARVSGRGQLPRGGP